MGEYLCAYECETTLKLNSERSLKEKWKQSSLVNNKAMYTSKIKNKNKRRLT